MIGLLIGYQTAKDMRKYDFFEVLKNGAIWGGILGVCALAISVLIPNYALTNIYPATQNMSSIIKAVDPLTSFIFGFAVGLVNTIIGSFSVPIYRWMKGIKI